MQRRLRRNQDLQATQILGEYHPGEVATALRVLEIPEQLRLLRVMGGGEAAAVIRHMNLNDLVGLVKTLSDHDLMGLVEHLPSDEIPQIMDRLGGTQATRIAEWMHGITPTDIPGGRFDAGTAGRTMRVGVWAISEDDTVGHAIEYVRSGDAYGQTSMLFVVDSHRHLLGVIPITALLGLAPTVPLRLIQTQRTMRVGPDASHRDVARLALQYSLQAVPVVDANGGFLGSLVADDVFSILRDELANRI